MSVQSCVSFAALCCVLCDGRGAALAQSVEPPQPFGPVPTAQQLAWQEIETRATICIGLGAYHTIPILDGSADPSLFNPVDFDARRWAATLKSFGFAAVTVPARRSDGYRMWPSSYSKHDVAQATWRDGAGDYVAEWSKVCRETGLAFGVSLAADDWAYLGTDAEYTTLFANEAKELVERYAPVAAFRMDCGPRMAEWYAPLDGEAVLATLRSVAPDLVCGSPLGPDMRTLDCTAGVPPRDATTEWARVDGAATLACTSDGISLTPSATGRAWCPTEASIVLRKREFFRKMDERLLPSAAQLEAMWFDTVGRGMSLDLGIAPMARGLLPAPEVALLDDLHRATTDTFATDLARGATISASNVRGGSSTFAASQATDGNRATYWATDDAVHSAQLVLEWKEAQRVSCVRLEEAVTLGQRITSYRVEARVASEAETRDGGTWREIARGTAVGLRRIDRFAPMDVRALRIIVESSVAPTLRHLGVYCEAPRVLSNSATNEVVIENGGEATIELRSDWPDAVMHYTLDGSTPTKQSSIVTGPVTVRGVPLRGSVQLQARAFAGDRVSPYALRVDFRRRSATQTTQPIEKPAR